MEIVVCIKRVPETDQVELAITEDKRSIKEDGLVFVLNEADEYATEEAVLLKEKFGGSVTVVTVGKEEATQQLRKCLAMGADRAIRLDDERFAGSDGYVIAKLLCAAIKALNFDLVLTGCISSDDGYGQVGVQLAQLLGLPHATLVTGITEIDGKKARIRRELESGLQEVIDVELPALLSVQTGINKPRYASFRSIRESRDKEIKVLGLSDLGLNEDDVGEAGSKVKLEKLFVSLAGSRAEIIEGTAGETTGKLAEILKERGLI